MNWLAHFEVLADALAAPSTEQLRAVEEEVTCPECGHTVESIQHIYGCLAAGDDTDGGW